MANDIQMSSELLQVASPKEWKGFLFKILTDLTNYGHIETLTEEGRHDFTGKMQALFDLFDNLEDK